MIQQESFSRDEVLPSWFMNRLQDRIAPLTNLRLDLSSATTVRANAGANDDAMVINVVGNWRKAESAVTRAHPGGSAGTYLVFVTGKAQTIVSSPLPNTDNTDYTFALAIVANGSTPTIVAGTVDIYRRVGRLTWDGSAITALVQEVGGVLGGQLDDAALVSSGVTATRQPGGGFLLEVASGAITAVKVAASLKPSGSAVAGDEALRALGTSGSTAAAGNDGRFPAGVDIVAGDISAALKPSGSAVAADEALRALGTAAGTAAAGNDARLSDSRAPSGAAGGDLTSTYPNPRLARAVVTAFPTTGLFDGMEVPLQTSAMVTNGLPPWLFRYRSGGGTYKWEAMSACPWLAKWRGGSTGSTGATYAQIAAISGSAITLAAPVPGIFLVRFGFQSVVPSSGSAPIDTYLVPVATSDARTQTDKDNDGIYSSWQGASGNILPGQASECFVTLLAAGNTVGLHERNPAGPAWAVSNPWLEIRPVLCG